MGSLFRYARLSGKEKGLLRNRGLKSRTMEGSALRGGHRLRERNANEGKRQRLGTIHKNVVPTKRRLERKRAIKEGRSTLTVM